MAKRTAASALKRSFFIARLMAKLSRSRGAASRPSVKIAVRCSAKESDAKERQRVVPAFLFRYARFAKAKPQEGKENKGSGTPTNAVQQPPRLATRLAPCKARSPVGVPPRLSPKGLIIPKARLQARLPGTRSERALPAFACPSPASTSHPGHNAGRLMPKPPGSGVQIRPRAPPSLPWPGMPPDHVLHVSEIWRLCNLNGDICQEIVLKNVTRSRLCPDQSRRCPQRVRA